MFNLVQCQKESFYLDCFTNVGVYHLGNGEVILIDGCDHKKSFSDLDLQLEARGWRVKAVFNTHAHIDHITGNRFFKEKYGCEIFSSESESHLIDFCTLEGQIYYNGIPIDRRRSYFFKPVGTKARPLCESDLPAGFEVIELPGHSYGSLGFRTPDGVWFIGDAVLSKETFETYKLPYFFDINKSIESQKLIATLDGSFFVPAHATPTSEIAPLALYNADCLERLKAFFLTISDNATFEEIFFTGAKALELKVDNDQYGKLSITVKSFLQALIEDGLLTAQVKDYRLVYERTKPAQ